MAALLGGTVAMVLLPETRGKTFAELEVLPFQSISHYLKVCLSVDISFSWGLAFQSISRYLEVDFSFDISNKFLLDVLLVYVQLISLRSSLLEGWRWQNPSTFNQNHRRRSRCDSFSYSFAYSTAFICILLKIHFISVLDNFMKTSFGKRIKGKTQTSALSPLLTFLVFSSWGQYWEEAQNTRYKRETRQSLSSFFQSWYLMPSQVPQPTLLSSQLENLDVWYPLGRLLQHKSVKLFSLEKMRAFL